MYFDGSEQQQQKIITFPTYRTDHELSEIYILIAFIRAKSASEHADLDEWGTSAGPGLGSGGRIDRNFISTHRRL